QKPARLFKQPLAEYPDEARNANPKDEVRLRLVLAADGTVKYIFPTKAAKHGLTEAAIAAARRIEFEPAIRNGRRASVHEYGVPIRGRQGTSAIRAHNGLLVATHSFRLAQINVEMIRSRPVTQIVAPLVAAALLVCEFVPANAQQPSKAADDTAPAIALYQRGQFTEAIQILRVLVKRDKSY